VHSKEGPRLERVRVVKPRPVQTTPQRKSSYERLETIKT
jgi:hypothetical protein